MASDRIATLIVKGSDSIFFYIALTGESQLFLNCNLNRKTVTIPTGFASYVFTFHRLITREDIFKDARFNVVSTRHSICSRWTFIESPRLTVLPCCCAGFKDRVFAPEIQDRALHCWQVDLSRNRTNCHKGESLTPAGLRDSAGNCILFRE